MSLITYLPVLGVIHGDLTLENLVFKKRDGSNEYLVNGVIDFMDTNIGGYIFEVANAMCSVMHAAVINGGIDPFMAVGITLKSILEHSFFNSTELDALFISVMGRLCTLIIFCRHDAANSPQTANHISLKFDILERILQDMWSIGNDEWKKSVLMEPTKNGVISLSNSLLREA